MFSQLVHWAHRSLLLQIFTIYTRYLIGGTFIFAFTWKTGDMFFYDPEAIPVDPHITPAFVFQVVMKLKGLWILVMLTQLVSGLLLATQRFATIGAILFYPVALSLFIITFSVGFEGTWLVTLLMLLAATYLLLWDWHKLRLLLYREHQLKMDYTQHTPGIMHLPFWERVGMVLVLVSLGNVWYNSIYFWLPTCLLIGLLAFFYFLFTRSRQHDIAAT